MSLYDRDYVHNQGVQQQEEYVYEEPHIRTESELATFIKTTYQLFAASCIAATAGAYLGTSIAPAIKTWYWGLVILEFVMLFGLMLTKKKPGINLMMLFGFTFLTGVTIAPLLSSILSLPGGGSIVGQAFFLTALITGGLSLFAMNTTRDFSNMGKGLFIALIIVVIASVVNIFLGNPMLQVIISGVSALLFSAFILYDTQNIIRGAFETPVEAAVAIYLDVFNLFVSLLQILGILGSNDE